MTEQYYIARRTELETEVTRLRQIHCHLCARARIRKIADLDYEVKGIDREITKQKFNYYEVKQ